MYIEDQSQCHPIKGLKLRTSLQAARVCHSGLILPNPNRLSRLLSEYTGPNVPRRSVTYNIFSGRNCFHLDCSLVVKVVLNPRFRSFDIDSTYLNMFQPFQVAGHCQGLSCRANCCGSTGAVLLVGWWKSHPVLFYYRYLYGSFVHTMLYDNADCQ